MIFVPKIFLVAASYAVILISTVADTRNTSNVKVAPVILPPVGTFVSDGATLMVLLAPTDAYMTTAFELTGAGISAAFPDTVALATTSILTTTAAVGATVVVGANVVVVVVGAELGVGCGAIVPVGV